MIAMNMQQPDPTPCWSCRVLDAEKYKAVDPLQPAIFPATLPNLPELVVQVDGVDAAVFAPCDAQALPPSTFALCLDAHERLVEQHGHEDTGETSEGYVIQGENAVCRAMPPEQWRREPLRVWRGELEAMTRNAEAAGRAWGLAPELIAALTGRPYIARKSLWPTCSKARERDRQQRDAAEAERAAEEAARIAAIADMRPRSPRELGIDVIAVKRKRVGIPDDTMPFPEFAPRLLWQDDTTMYLGWLAPPAVHLPFFDRDGIRALPRDEDLVPADANRAHEPDGPVLGFIRERRQQDAGGDFGPVAGRNADVTDDMRAFVHKNARWLISLPPQFAWKPTHLAECLVRSEWSLRADVAYLLLLEGAAAEYARQNPAVSIPLAALKRRRTNEDGSLPDEWVGPLRLDEIRALKPEDQRWRKGSPTKEIIAATPLPDGFRTGIARLIMDAVTRGALVAAGSPLVALPMTTTTKHKKK